MPYWNVRRWLRYLAPPDPPGRRLASRPSVRPLLERLEDRLTPTLLTVLNNADSGVGSLRDALAAANNGDVIDFAANVRTIDLTSGGLAIGVNLTIQNDQGGSVTIDGGGQFTVFTINPGVTAALSGLTISDGFKGEGSGGGVENNGTLTVSDSTFSGNSANNGGGGGILNFGTLTVGDSTFSGNSTSGFGGAAASRTSAR